MAVDGDRPNRRPGKPGLQRAYQSAALKMLDGGVGVALDDRPLQTPAGRALIVPTVALGEAIAAEWAAQVGEIRHDRMPLTRLAMTAIDRVGPRRAAATEAAMKFAETDLVCYRASEPAALAARQRLVWDPLIAWAQTRFGVIFTIVAGVMPHAQPPATLHRLRAVLDRLDPWRLTAATDAAVLSTSLIIALALLERRIAADEAFTVSQLDETFEIERWGEDEEAETRRADLRAALHEVAEALRLLAEP